MKIWSISRLIVPVCVIAGAGIAVTLPSKLQDLDGVHAKNLSKVKQAGLAMLMYSNDYDDVLPYSQSTGGAIEVTQPYLKNLDVWWFIDGRRLLYSNAMAGVNMTSIEEPAKTVMLYPEKAAEDGFREIGFSDGHAKRLDAEAWKIAEPTLRLKISKSGKPLPANLGSKYNTSKPPEHTR